MSRSSTAWVFRAVCGALALLFIGVIQNGRATDAHDRALQQLTAENAPVVFESHTPAGDRASAMVIDDELFSLSLILRFHCTPSVGRTVRAYYDQAPDHHAHGVARHRGPVRRVRLFYGWRGRSDLAYDVHYDARHLTGTVSAHLVLDAGGRHATCTSVPTRLDLPVTR